MRVRADWVARRELEHILAALMPQNRLALEVSLATGLRISDVLSIKAEQLQRASDRRITVREMKTGKSRRIKLPLELYERMLRQAGRVWVWEGRLDWRKHRTRQAINKDLERCAALFRLPRGLHLSPHTARKSYAVEAYHRTGDLKRVQKLLQHSRESITILYAMADALTERKLGGPVRGDKASGV